MGTRRILAIFGLTGRSPRRRWASGGVMSSDCGSGHTTSCNADQGDNTVLRQAGPAQIGGCKARAHALALVGAGDLLGLLP